MQIVDTRHDTAAGWAASNPVLAKTETGYEDDTGKFKVGDGITSWNGLAYSVIPGVSVSIKADDSDKLDGLDSSQFLRSTGKAADSDLLDGLDSSAFLRSNGKAVDSDLLDGLDSSAFARLAANLVGYGQLESHGTYTDFNTISDFGFHYVQGATNGPNIAPGSGLDQYYCLSLSLGSQYPFSQYVCQIAWKRNIPGSMATRFREGGAWGPWGIASRGAADSGWTNLPVVNGFTSGGSTPQYRKDNNGWVRLRGQVSGNNIALGTIMFTLPAGYRPSSTGNGDTYRFPTNSYNGSAEMYGCLEMRGNGNVYAIAGGIAGWFSLDSVSFLAEQ